MSEEMTEVKEAPKKKRGRPRKLGKEVIAENPATTSPAEEPKVEPKKVSEPKIEFGDVALYRDELKVENRNPKYEYRWCNSNNMANNRKGNWVSVDRKDIKPGGEHEGLSVAVDHSPDQTYIQYRDLILCYMPMELADKRRKLHSERVQKKTGAIEAQFKSDIDRTARALGKKDGVSGYRSL